MKKHLFISLLMACSKNDAYLQLMRSDLDGKELFEKEHTEDFCSKIDLGTNKQKLPVVSLFPSDFLVNNSYGYTPGGGNNIGLYVEDHKIYYKHLYENSIAYASMYNLNNYAEKAGIWSFSIPSNYQIGNAGNSGSYSTGIHLHMEINKVKR